MRNLLLPPQLRALAEFMRTSPVLAFDFDGTLVPIVRDASQARMRERTRSALIEVCRLFPCALLTGRSREDAVARVEGIPFVHVLGNHGAEGGADWSGFDAAPLRARTTEWVRWLEGEVKNLPGVFVEDKRLSLSVHYRGAARKKDTIARIHEALGRMASVPGLGGLRVIGGKQVVNVLPSELGGKGQALLELKRRLGRSTALFIGDDLNDEEVFELPEDSRVFKVRVEKSARSLAEYYVTSQLEVDGLLESLARLGRERAAAS